MGYKFKNAVVLCVVTASFFPAIAYEYSLKDSINKGDFICVGTQDGEAVASFNFYQKNGYSLSEKLFEIRGRVKNQYLDQGIGPLIREQCIELMKKQVEGAGFITNVESANYPSLRYNLALNMIPYGIDCSGTWLFIDREETASTLNKETKESRKKDVKDLGEKCEKKIKNDIIQLYNNDFSGFYPISKEILKEKGIQSAAGYYTRIVKLGEKNGIYLSSNNR
jgi:hypothetical protein